MGIGPAVAVSPQWVFSDGSWLGVDPGWTTWLYTLGQRSTRSCPSGTRLFLLGSCLYYPLGPESWLLWTTRLGHQHSRPALPALSVSAYQQCRSWKVTVTVWSLAGRRCCCCCLPTPMTLASGGSPMFPLVVHQPASPSIWPAVQSLRRGLSTNPGVDNVVRM